MTRDTSDAELFRAVRKQAAAIRRPIDKRSTFSAYSTSSTQWHAMQAESWALIGNAVTVPVAKWLGQRLMQPYR